MTQQQFLALPESEQNIFFAKVIHCIKNNHTSLEHAVWFVGLCENIGVLNNVKFGSEVYHENNAITVID